MPFITFTMSPGLVRLATFVMVRKGAVVEVPLFALLDGEDRRTLAEMFNTVHVDKGDPIFSDGDPGDSLYIVRRGKVEIFMDEACEAELARVLAYDLGKHSIDAAAQAACLSLVEKSSTRVKEKRQAPLPRCSDPDDQKFLELAASARADALVTKDAALLQLRRRAPFRILTPADLGLLLAYELSEYVVFNPDFTFKVGEPNATLD